MSGLDLDLPAGLLLRLLEADERARRAVERQLGLGVRPAEASARPDLVLRFVDRLPSSGRLRLLGLDEAAFDDESFLVLRGRFKSRARVRIPLEAIGTTDAGGDPPEVVCERGLASVPLLVALLNLTALGRGVLPLHASAFVESGVGCLCTGWSKGGKTEALLAFADRGARYVGDEWVWLPPGGELLAGLPEPVRVWRWHLEELESFRGALALGERARLGTLGLAYAGIRRATADGARHGGVATRTLNRIAPLLRRQLGVDVSPRKLFGVNGSPPVASFDRLFFVVSREGEGIDVRPVDPLLVARRMVASLQTEMAPLRACYEAFRFAFPERPNETLERSAELQRALLEQAFAGKPACEVAHPYPVSLPALHAAMAPFVEAR